MRQINDPDFASFLDTIGDNYEQETVDLGRLRHTESIQTLIDFVFPPNIAVDPIICISRAILSPFNFFVDEFNSTILRTVPGQSHTYISSDSIEGDTDGSDNSILADPEFLNTLDEPGIPPHEVTWGEADAAHGITRTSFFIFILPLTKNKMPLVQGAFHKITRLCTAHMQRNSDIPRRIDRRPSTVSLPGALRNPMRPPLRILPSDVRTKPQFSLGFVRKMLDCHVELEGEIVCSMDRWKSEGSFR
jgi:hypothetical protein